MPKLEFGQSPDKRSELLILLCGQRGFAVLKTLVLRQARVKFRLEEGQEEVEEINAKAVGDDVPALCNDNA